MGTNKHGNSKNNILSFISGKVCIDQEEAYKLGKQYCGIRCFGVGMGNKQ